MAYKEQINKFKINFYNYYKQQIFNNYNQIIIIKHFISELTVNYYKYYSQMHFINNKLIYKECNKLNNNININKMK